MDKNKCPKSKIGNTFGNFTFYLFLFQTKETEKIHFRVPSRYCMSLQDTAAIPPFSLQAQRFHCSAPVAKHKF